MPHYFFKGMSLNCRWTLVRETNDSLIADVVIPYPQNDRNCRVDIHFTRERIATCGILSHGADHKLTDGMMNDIMQDISRLALTCRSYRLIDYSYANSPDSLFNGNYTIHDDDIKGSLAEHGNS